MVVDEKRVGEAEAAATVAAAAHPCRLLVVVRRRTEAAGARLDAEVLIGGRLGPGEAVVMRMYGRLALHAESVVLPLLAADAPVVTWWHAEPPGPDRAPTRWASSPTGGSPTARWPPTRSPRCASGPRTTRPGDTDLAWTRSTPWRTLCAATFDSAEGRGDRGHRARRQAGDPASPGAGGRLADQPARRST